MKNMILFFCCISLICCSCSSCKDGFSGDKRYRVTMTNHSANNISFYVSNINHVYPDTAIENSRVAMQNILAGRSGFWDISYTLDQYFEELPRDTLSFFIFSTDTLNTYDWSTIRDEYKILKRYDLSLADLRAMNETIVYP